MKRMLSGIQPTNKITLGNYFGAIQSFLGLQSEYDCYIFVADLHAITNPKLDFSKIAENKKKLICLYYACGLDLDKCKIFFQSSVHEHCELFYILVCHSTMGELKRMTQFKDKLKKITTANGTETAPTGLFIYPVLMAADILLYDPDIVPVGKDQKQHIELARNLAIRLNNKYGNIFNIPTPYIPTQGAKIMDLVNPNIKMSKSNLNEDGVIFLLDDIEISLKKIMNAKTDCMNIVKFDPINQPAISNLVVIYSLLSNLSYNEIQKKFNGKNYYVFKKELCSLLKNQLMGIQKKYDKFYKEYDNVISPILDRNLSIVREVARKKIEFIQKRIGISK